MKSFEEKPECVKCGSHSTRIKYYPSECGKDILSITCNICGYNWDMKTKDATEKP